LPGPPWLQSTGACTHTKQRVNPKFIKTTYDPKAKSYGGTHQHKRTLEEMAHYERVRDLRIVRTSGLSSGMTGLQESCDTHLWPSIRHKANG
jgi:hypothetical protein